MMNDFNLESFTFGEELEKIINSQQETAKEVKENAFEDLFAIDTEGTEEDKNILDDPFADFTFDKTVDEEITVEEEPENTSNTIVEEDLFDINFENVTNTEELEVDDIFTTLGDDILNTNTEDIDFGFGQDRYINAMHAFANYMPINLSVDRDIPANFKSLVDFDSDLPTIVIEKLPNKMIALIHNLRKRPLPAIPTESRQPVVSWNGTIQEFMSKLEESITFTHGFDEEEFKAMRKVVIVENMNDKTDLDQNEIYVTRQDAIDLLLNKYNSIIDLTDEKCSINFKENGKKYSFNIGGLGYNCNLDKEWAEEIRSKIVFMKNNEILLTGIAASPRVVSTLKDTYGFKIINETNEIKSLAVEI